MKKPSKTTLRNKLDKLFSLVVRTRDGKCLKCYRSNDVTLQCAHIASRRFLSGRWNEHNAITLCAACHRWGHDNPTKFSEWIKEYYPSVFEESLEVKGGTWKPKTQDYQELVEQLKTRLQSLERVGKGKV